VPVTKPLSASELLKRCDPEQFSFETTAELPELPGSIGQERAIEAIRFGMGMRREGYNLFALGPPGLGKHGLVQQLLEERAIAEETPSDWCYVHNFDDSRRPRALQLPPGKGAPLSKDMDQLLEELRAAIPAALEGDDVASRRKLLEEKLKRRQEGAFEGIEREAKEKGIAVVKTPVGLGLGVRRDGDVLTP